MNIHDLHSRLGVFSKNNEDFEKVFNTYRDIIEINTFTPEEREEIGYDIDPTVTFTIGEEEIKVATVEEIDALKERLTSAGEFTAEQYGQIYSLSPRIDDVLDNLSDDTEFWLSEVGENTCGGEVWYIARRNGNKVLDYDAAASRDIIEKGFNDWRKDCRDGAASLNIYFDTQKYPEICQQINNLTVDAMPKEDREGVEWFNEGLDEEELDPKDFFVANFFWEYDNFSLLQPYLDKVNEIIRPIRDEIEDASFTGFWADIKNLAIATVKYDKETGFHVVGCEL